MFLTTVAGMASRFCADLEVPRLKCIYYESTPERTILYRLLDQASAYDRFYVVGGFQFEALRDYIGSVMPAEWRDKITMVDNPLYETTGSGWSLYLGLRAIEESCPDTSEVLFAEGDLCLDTGTLHAIGNAKGDVLTVNREEIRADKSVVLYYNAEDIPHYLYDTTHGTLRVEEAFHSIHNSGQVWKFADPTRLFSTMHRMPEERHKKTNLELIDAYYADSQGRNAERVCFQTWINCNTLADYRRIPF